MNNKRRLINSVLEIVTGAALLIGVKLAGGDSVWLGMGGALIVVGLIQFVQGLRYQTDEVFREKTNTEAQDERNAFLRTQAWTWAGTGFVIVGGILTILFLLLGKRELSTLCGSGVSLLVLFYWLSFLVLRKKY